VDAGFAIFAAYRSDHKTQLFRRFIGHLRAPHGDGLTPSTPGRKYQHWNFRDSNWPPESKASLQCCPIFHFRPARDNLERIVSQRLRLFHL
jgi:hypothetical protein